MIASGASQDQIKEVNFGAREKSEEWKSGTSRMWKWMTSKRLFSVYFYSTEYGHDLYRVHKSTLERDGLWCLEVIKGCLRSETEMQSKATLWSESLKGSP